MVDARPETQLHQALYKLKGNYDFDKVSELMLSHVHNEHFIKTLHSIDDFEQLRAVVEQAALLQQQAEDEEAKELEPSILTAEDDKEEEEVDLPELDNLMKDSVLSEANLSAVQTPQVISHRESCEVDSNF